MSTEATFTLNCSKLGTCHVCREKNARYKCPRCATCSCSLECVTTHKTEKNCNGIRNRIEMVLKEDMDNLTLLSDYRFLEEIDHKLEDGLRNPLRISIVKGKEVLQDLPNHLQRLKLEAKKRGTFLDFLPRHFVMHQENSTRFNFSDKIIRWHIKLVFPQADLSFTEESVNENTLLVTLLRKYMEPPNRLDDDESSLTAEEQEKLAYYHSASYRRIAVLFKSHLCNKDKQFIELDLSKSLKANLKNRKVVEYPVVYVVLRDHLDVYLEEDTTLPDSYGNQNSSDTEGSQNTLQIKNFIGKDSKRELGFFQNYSDMSEESD